MNPRKLMRGLLLIFVYALLPGVSHAQDASASCIETKPSGALIARRPRGGGAEKSTTLHRAGYPPIGKTFLSLPSSTSWNALQDI